MVIWKKGISIKVSFQKLQVIFKFLINLTSSVQQTQQPFHNVHLVSSISIVDTIFFTRWLSCNSQLFELLYFVDPVYPFSSDLWHRQSIFFIHTAAVNWIFSLFFFKQREFFSSFWNTWLGPSLSHFEPQFDQQFISTWHWIAAMWLDNSRFVWTSIWSGVPNKVDDECRINVSTVTCHYCWCE